MCPSLPDLAQENQRIVAWLSPLDFSAIQMDYFSRWEDGTGEWLLEKDEFNAWLRGTVRTIWCCGIRNFHFHYKLMYISWGRENCSRVSFAILDCI